MKMKQQFNGLTPAEHERLSLLFEECGEVIQIVGKIMRHGFNSCHPEGVTTNRELLEKELGHVAFAASFMCQHGDIEEMEVTRHTKAKEKNVNPYLHHNNATALECNDCDYKSGGYCDIHDAYRNRRCEHYENN